ncbi:MAG: hypothetical protein ACE5Q3_14085 [Alphaproteobacteria bacterium]
MSRFRLASTVVGVTFVLGGCSFVDETLFPSNDQEPEVAAASEPIEIAPSAAEAGAAPSAPEPVGVTPGADTGTVVGARVAQLRADLERMQTAIGEHQAQLQTIQAEGIEDAQRYNSLVASIQSRLQVGTTPGNPILVRQWNEAQSVLDKISSDIGRMNNLANRVAGDSSLAAFVLESTRATFGLSGAVDEDHRQLRILEDEVNRTVVEIDRVLNELNTDITRQSNFIGRERSNLTVLSLAVKNGELFGTSLSNRAFASAAPVAGASQVTGDPSRRPLVLIRFDQETVDYEQPLFTAVSEALERRPDALFDLVAVTPNRGTPAQVALSASAARRNAERVLRSLSAMGLPADRVNVRSLSSNDAQVAEVHLYVR